MVPFLDPSGRNSCRGQDYYRLRNLHQHMFIVYTNYQVEAKDVYFSYTPLPYHHNQQEIMTSPEHPTGTSQKIVPTEPDTAQSYEVSSLFFPTISDYKGLINWNPQSFWTQKSSQRQKTGPPRSNSSDRNVSDLTRPWCSNFKLITMVN